MSPRGDELNKKMRNEAVSKITRAALEVFAEYGYYGTKMSRIMEMTGLSKGLVYHYFPSKEKIFFHLIETALEISRNIWKEALDPPGTAWEKIERLSASLVRTAYTEESSLYYLIMVQAITQGNGMPGLMEFIYPRMSHYEELPRLIAEAQQSGEAAQGDPEVLSSAYFAMFQGFTLFLLHDEELKSKVTPEIFLRILRNPGKQNPAIPFREE